MKIQHKSQIGRFNNDASLETHQESVHFDIEKNGIKIVDDDTLLFSKPVVITDNSEMWSGAKYDIPTLDITEYKGKLTADHIDRIQNVIGSVIGVKKVANRKVTIDGIKLATKENPLADYAKRMIMAGHLTDFSIETIGPWPDDDGIFKNAKLVGLSLVVTGNNKQAHINKIVEATIEDAKRNGTDYAAFAQALKIPIDKQNLVHDNNTNMKFKKITNSKSFVVTLKYKNSAGEDTEITLKAGQSIDVPDTDENKGVEGQVTDATEPKAPVAPKIETPKIHTEDTSVEVATIVKNAVEAATKPLMDKVEKLEKTSFDNSVQEPKFVKMSKGNATDVGVDALDWHTRYTAQVNNAWDWLKGGSEIAHRKLTEINKYNLEALQEAGKVQNAVTISDFGNFVISPELLSEIEGFRSNFQPLLSRLNFRDTLSLQMAWLTRSGDINMQEVDMCEDGDNGNLKPISEYSAAITTDNLHELAAVTPVCNAATRFLAADLLSDVSAGYRNDFDRKRAQIFIARLQQAVNTSANVVNYATGTGGGGANVNAMQNFFSVGAMQEEIMNGVYVMSQASFWELAGRRFASGINTNDSMQLFTKGPNGETMLLGAPVIVVPNELLPKLGSSQTRVFAVGGVNITVTMAVFYVDLSTFTGRTSGGLNYDLSTEAAYEENGVVKSAYQRNELVLRGSFFRGGAVRDPEKVVGLRAVNLS